MRSGGRGGDGQTFRTSARTGRHQLPKGPGRRPRGEAGLQGARERQEDQGEGRWSQRGWRGSVSPGSEASLLRGRSGEMESKGCCPWGRFIMDEVGSREGEARGRGA